MGCPSLVLLGNNVTFTIVCHDADTGERTDASAVTYKVYEEDSEDEILTGSMSKHDSETGFYLKKIAATAANGFEHGKTYTILIEATVDSVNGGISYAFQVFNW